jgi:hypothetical protein
MLLSLPEWSLCLLTLSLSSLSSAQGPTNSATDSSATITSAPAFTSISTYSPDQIACISQGSYDSVCNVLTPGFSTLTDFVLQAPCLCYSSTSWLPSLYDGWVSSCFQYYITASPSFYASLTQLAGGAPATAPCQEAGNVLAQLSSYDATASTTFNEFGTTTTPASVTSTTSTVPTSTVNKSSGSKVGVSLGSLISTTQPCVGIN